MGYGILPLGEKGMSMEAGRNDPCPCGSGKKFKKCCMGKAQNGLKGRIQQKSSADSELPANLSPGDRGKQLLSRVKQVVHEVPFWERDNLTMDLSEKDYRQATGLPSILKEESEARGPDYPQPTLRKNADPNAPLASDRFSDDADPTVTLEEVDYRPPA